MTLLVIAMLPVLVALGFWQLSRYEQKLMLEQAYESRHALDPFSLSQVQRHNDPLYLPFTVSGRFDRDRYFLLDNQVYQGEVGYELFMPFLTDGGEWLLVNRGWIVAGDREVLPKVVTDPGHLVLIGFAYKPLGKPFMLAEDVWEEGWPKRIQAFDSLKISEAIEHETADFFMVLRAGQPGVEQIRPMVINLKSEKHLGYAFQWFAMALALLLLYGFQMIRAGRNKLS
ncbi:SURF1 family protein [Endozoicomonas sp. SCSIO W0465]|uniref:SURF1 family protein n=1 Tax=Endozoicomonas sp. SCSIO W0465 TaxID=2918516 RepID=UPI00207569E6|nr:SURF1 family protein [Endozoicomonas sp. SCSIO W0465]USE36647.1 SURF1 family protein [Endozoicomonas sp. SCSIO W0465]